MTKNAKWQDNMKAIIRMCESHDGLIQSLERMLDESPFMSDANRCECGEWGTGWTEDHNTGEPCEHIQARRALAKATQS